MPRFVYEKMGITEGHKVLAIDGPAESIEAIQLPAQAYTDPHSLPAYDHILLFRITRKSLETAFTEYKKLLESTGKLWVVWPKAKQLDTDLNIKEVIRIGYNYGLVESTNLRVDDVWTALKFTYPKPGKVYNNSYGTLPS